MCIRDRVFVYLFFGVYDVVGGDETSSLSTLFSRYNLNIVAAQTTIVALAALGMTLVIISGGIDLSPGSSIALTTTVVAVWLRDGGSPVVALVLGTACAALVGFANGAMITGLRIVTIIETLGKMGIARGSA